MVAEDGSAREAFEPRGEAGNSSGKEMGKMRAAKRGKMKAAKRGKRKEVLGSLGGKMTIMMKMMRSMLGRER